MKAGEYLREKGVDMENTEKLFTEKVSISDLLFSLTSFTTELLWDAGAIEAIHTVMAQSTEAVELFSKNEFLYLSECAIWYKLLLNTTKILDNGAYKDNINCSFKALHRALGSTELEQSKVESVIQSIDELYKKYDVSISAFIRNKKIAHHDYDLLFGMDSVQTEILFFNVIDIIEMASGIICKVYYLLYGDYMDFPPISCVAKVFEKKICEALHISYNST